jgi:hypothetical protein
MLSIGAGAIHFSVIPAHVTEYVPYAALFAALAWYQVSWPLTYLCYRVTWLTWLTVAVNTGAVMVWAWSRTVGLPFGPEPGEVEAMGPLDITATAWEVVLITLLVVLAWGPVARAVRGGRLTRRGAWIGSLIPVGIIVLVTTIALLSPGEPHAH